MTNEKNRKSKIEYQMTNLQIYIHFSQVINSKRLATNSSYKKALHNFS